MKIVVIGGTGLIGSKTVVILRQSGHEVVAASPKSGVNTITGEGLKEAMAGAQVVIDLANSPSFEDKAVLNSSKLPGATFSRRRPPGACPKTISLRSRGGRCSMAFRKCSKRFGNSPMNANRSKELRAKARELLTVHDPNRDSFTRHINPRISAHY